MKPFLSLVLVVSLNSVFGQAATAKLDFEYDYLRCPDLDFEGFHMVDINFYQDGEIIMESTLAEIKSKYASDKKFARALKSIQASGGSSQDQYEAQKELYNFTERSTKGSYLVKDGSLKIYIDSGEILNTEFLSCELDGRYLMCGDLNFVLDNDDVIMNDDVLYIQNVANYSLAFQEDSLDRWIIQILSDNPTLVNGERFRLKRSFQWNQYLGYKENGTIGLYPFDAPGIYFDFVMYDEEGSGEITLWDDLKIKPADYFDNNYFVVGIDSSTDNVRVRRRYNDEENIWWIELAMCDIVDKLVGSK